ncbi:hypothetical protein OG883_23885 [Streptomyces sp. NBC_01142]|nr:hypothetical protein [Streptomyces sp. NBC_01142]MCX4822881.1 hypothetical protein [Streptomyces sp. NBC_01142]
MDDEREPEETEGGEPPCLLDRVCPACGRLAESGGRVCEQCGEHLPSAQ